MTNDHPPPRDPHARTEAERRDDTDLVAAALGLRSSAWAQAVVHLTEPEFNAAINGEQVLKDGKPVDATPQQPADAGEEGGDGR